jgi:hypothetical protein
MPINCFFLWEPPSWRGNPSHVPGLQRLMPGFVLPAVTDKVD